MIIPFPTEWKNHPFMFQSPPSSSKSGSNCSFHLGCFDRNWGPSDKFWDKATSGKVHLLLDYINQRKSKCPNESKMCLIDVRCLMIKISHFRQPKLNSAFLLVKIPKFFLGYLDCHLRPPVYCITSSFHNLQCFYQIYIYIFIYIYIYIV